MKTFNLIKKSLVITFASIILACGAETLVALVFIPAFAATWPVVGEDEYRFQLDPNGDNRGVESGVFGGLEIEYPEDLDNEANTLTGSFNGLNIEFKVERISSDDQDTTFVQFTGTMKPVSNEDHNITRINLNSPDGELVLSFE